MQTVTLGNIEHRQIKPIINISAIQRIDDWEKYVAVITQKYEEWLTDYRSRCDISGLILLTQDEKNYSLGIVVGCGYKREVRAFASRVVVGLVQEFPEVIIAHEVLLMDMKEGLIFDAMG